MGTVADFRGEEKSELEGSHNRPIHTVARIETENAY
jgi:hypothetical protein